jgi:hypothetical protein
MENRQGTHLDDLTVIVEILHKRREDELRFGDLHRFAAPSESTNLMPEVESCW